MRCKRDGYTGFIVLAKAANRDSAVDDLMDRCRSKGQRNVNKRSGSSAPGWVYAVGQKI